MDNLISTHTLFVQEYDYSYKSIAVAQTTMLNRGRYVEGTHAGWIVGAGVPEQVRYTIAQRNSKKVLGPNVLEWPKRYMRVTTENQVDIMFSERVYPLQEPPYFILTEPGQPMELKVSVRARCDNIAALPQFRWMHRRYNSGDRSRIVKETLGLAERTAFCPDYWLPCTVDTPDDRVDCVLRCLHVGEQAVTGWLYVSRVMSITGILNSSLRCYGVPQIDSDEAAKEDEVIGIITNIE